MSNKIIIINGPNLNLLGEREQSQYGTTSFEQLKENCLKKGIEIGLDIDFVQSNIEGELVEEIQKSRKNQEKAPAVQTCKKCFATYSPQPACPECGYFAPIKTREITEQEGELIELKRTEVRLRQAEKDQAKMLIRKARSLEELKAVADPVTLLPELLC